MTSTDYLYFIITTKPEYPGHISAGCICFIREHKYRSDMSHSPKKLPVFKASFSQLHYMIDLSCMEQLSADEAELLQALPEDTDRLKWFKEKNTLQTAMGLTKGTPVTVDQEKQGLRGIIRFIGRLTEPPSFCPLSGTFFGIELQVGQKRK